MHRNSVLLVDDEPTVRLTIRRFLEAKGFEVIEAEGCARAIEVTKDSSPDAAILDYELPDGNALDLLKKLRGLGRQFPVIVLTGHGSIDLAVAAIKEGAEQFLTKPVELPTLQLIIERVIENARNRQKQRLRDDRRARSKPNPFVGPSPVIKRLAEEARRIAATDRPVLIQGETGSGKGTLAAWIHDHGPRASEAMVDMNCAGLSKELLETELFGHEKGAFTGAVAAKEGLLEVAHRGTFFLDEIGDADVAVQPKLLKVLEEKRFRRVGDVRDRVVDVRLIAASHQDLSVLVKEGRFRGDLFYRISTLPIRMPALRERPEDIPALAAHLLETLAQELGRVAPPLNPEAERALGAYHWPGNVRELRNVLERATLLSDRDVLTVDDLRLKDNGALARPSSSQLSEGRSTGSGPNPGSPRRQAAPRTLDEVERDHIEDALAQLNGSVVDAAKALGLSRSALYERLKKHGLAAKPKT